MERLIRTSDVFEASFYQSQGLFLVKIEVHSELPHGSECRFVFSGDEKIVDELAAQYLTGRATVNLIQFRRSYWESCQNVRKAKRSLASKKGSGL